jgi:O-antigen/teichoic acid export membrane protein
VTLRHWIGTDDVPLVDADVALEARQSRRDRRAAVSTVTAIVARGAMLLGSFIAIPLTIGYLGVGRYGILLTLTSLTSMFVFADLGLGNGLLNVVSDANGRDDRDAASRAVSSAFFMLVGVAGILAVAFVVALPLVNWMDLFHTAGAARDEIVPTATVLFGIFVVALPLGVVDRVRMGYQEGFINSIASVAGALVGLLALIVAIALHASLPLLVLAISAPPIVALALNGYHLFLKDRPWLRPRLRLADRAAALGLARIGLLFLILQLAVAVAFQADVIVAATVLGPAAAATYAVTLKFFMLAPSLVGLFLATLWPAYTEAIARSDPTWIRQMLKRSVLIAVAASGGASLALFVGGPWLIATWTAGAITPPPALLLGAALWAIVSSGFNAIAILFNAASIVFFQVRVATTMAIASITLSVILANVVGVSGIVWGTLIAYVLFAGIPIAIYAPRVLKSFGSPPPKSGSTQA